MLVTPSHAKDRPFAESNRPGRCFFGHMRKNPQPFHRLFIEKASKTPVFSLSVDFASARVCKKIAGRFCIPRRQEEREPGHINGSGASGKL